MSLHLAFIFLCLSESIGSWGQGSRRIQCPAASGIYRYSADVCYWRKEGRNEQMNEWFWSVSGPSFFSSVGINCCGGQGVGNTFLTCCLSPSPQDGAQLVDHSVRGSDVEKVLGLGWLRFLSSGKQQISILLSISQMRQLSLESLLKHYSQ